MKTNHESIINYIRQAIRSCNEDAALTEVKQYLFAALRKTENVGNKRSTRATQAKFYEEQAKKRNEQWMDMLKKGLQLPEEFTEND